VTLHRRMRSPFICALVMISLFSLQDSSAVTTKSGARCTKLGQTSVVSFKKYTCIKSGKKLVWNKGVAVSKPITKPTPTPTPTFTVIARVEVQRHNLETDCWSIISGFVYNLTTLLIQHPGGSEPIKAVCGTDGTASFLGQHANQGEQVQQLEKLRIGILG
jgi:cytochrome b involved in lipid metabolism